MLFLMLQVTKGVKNMGGNLDNEIELAYHKFCKIMGLKENTWSSVIEFTCLTGMGVIRSNHIRKLKVIRRSMDILNGPNGETIIRAHKVRRYQLSGLLIASCKKAAITMFIITMAALEALRNTWRSI